MPNWVVRSCTFVQVHHVDYIVRLKLQPHSCQASSNNFRIAQKSAMKSYAAYSKLIAKFGMSQKVCQQYVGCSRHTLLHLEPSKSLANRVVRSCTFVQVHHVDYIVRLKLQPHSCQASSNNFRIAQKSAMKSYAAYSKLIAKFGMSQKVSHQNVSCR